MAKLIGRKVHAGHTIAIGTMAACAIQEKDLPAPFNIGRGQSMIFLT